MPLKRFNEFKEFAIKGNVLDMAVGIIIGAAFTTVVKSIVDDIIMPIIGFLTGGIDFSNLYINLTDESFESFSAAKEAGAAVIGYGQFINATLSFLIVAWVLFILVKSYNRIEREWIEDKQEETAKDKKCPYCQLSVSVAATRCPHCTSDLK